MNMLSGELFVYFKIIFLHHGRYLEERRLEGRVEEKVKFPEDSMAAMASNALASNSHTEAKLTRRISTYSPPKRILQRSR